MNIYFDTEFTGLHKDTTLISLGMVDENGRTFYAEFNDYDKSQVNEWIEENVISNLDFIFNDYVFEHDNNTLDKANFVVKGSKEFVRAYLQLWLKSYDEVQLVGDVCHYDMMLFISIFGTAFDLPINVSPTCHDINQDIAKHYECTERVAFDMSRELIALTYADGQKHNALYDAQVIRKIYGRVV